MADYSSVLRLLWFGSGLLGSIILARNPEKLVIENTFWGSVPKTLTLIILPASIVGGPITLLFALLLPKRKLCSHCFKTNRSEDTICVHCGKSMIETISGFPGGVPALKRNSRFSPEVMAAVQRGTKVVNLPIPFIMMAVMFGLLALGALVFKSQTITLASFPVGFISGWLWWSYSVPRWRKWALEQPGVSPDELQAAGEAAMLVWPKGSFFEKTEFKIKK